ncbi:MAG: pentapeptide repeat-containing protein [Dolichospermum sp. DET50]|nr:pentapeptide repeat-containing protein [Dolichospermum sp. DET66]MBS3032593.1 pentapeptide repeat-containing protein [Dolichospermum sp. DET67]MBS3037799.1 pentapeptide repeat-containing protein [Dolichospermum sp. DET50]QSX69737.1 MAG: pentapeptide repeat-containing protein [Dolichospermum sp. DET69]
MHKKPYKNLRGCSFKDKDLAGADFSDADIRGADFSGANLQGANFTNAQAGLQKRWAIFLVIVSLLLSGLSGSIAGQAGYIAAQGFNAFQSSNQIAGWAVIAALFTFSLLTIGYGIQAGLGVIAVAFVVTGILAVINIAPIIVFGTAASIGIGSVAASGAGAFAIASAGIFSLTGAIVGSVAGVIAGILIVDGAKVFTAAFTFAGVVVLLSFYISYQAMKGNEKHIIIRNIAIAFSAFGGTSFRKANLTDANFTGASLKGTDFRNANVVRTCFYNAQMLDRIRPGSTYLQKAQLRHLLVTRLGQNKNFDHQDLRGVNLQEANLENASFIDVDFYQANLSNANLSRSILVRTNFERANLRGACLTGSCIQDWILTKGTNLEGIVCDYVYLKWVDGDKRDPMPHRGNFKKGGFILFAKYILDTIDIYHNKDINPRLALTVLKKMSKDYDETLDIVAVGKRGDKVFIKVKLSETVDSQKFKEDYLSRYDDGLILISSSSTSLPSVDELLENRLAEIASNNTDKIPYVNVTYIEYINTPQDLIIQGEVTVENIETRGDTIRQSGSFGIGVNKGTVNTEKLAGTINEANQQNLAEAAKEIQNLLKQLKETNPTETSTVIAAKAADEIRNNSTLKARVISALKSGGKEAFKEAVDNPLVNVLVAIIEGWQEAE